jgi:hypothetical protein
LYGTRRPEDERDHGGNGQQRRRTVIGEIEAPALIAFFTA